MLVGDPGDLVVVVTITWVLASLTLECCSKMCLAIIADGGRSVGLGMGVSRRWEWKHRVSSAANWGATLPSGSQAEQSISLTQSIDAVGNRYPGFTGLYGRSRQKNEPEPLDPKSY
ncbi:hypothetical protein RRF57_002277 [Xylaria bambusicola]|uniref:Uncharacterized protein n=1 Tax=Xylaria bambusicola TaxID=326684 RepID=A0AAN7UF16_9PEZI